MNTEILKHWNRLESSEKLELIESAIDLFNTNDGFLMLRYWRKDDILGAYITNSIVNDLCVEAVSKDTLIDLFGEDHEYQIDDAVAILNWMENQK
jgi:hypothetical protein